YYGSSRKYHDHNRPTIHIFMIFSHPKLEGVVYLCPEKPKTLDQKPDLISMVNVINSFLILQETKLVSFPISNNPKTLYTRSKKMPKKFELKRGSTQYEKEF